MKRGKARYTPSMTRFDDAVADQLRAARNEEDAKRAVAAVVRAAMALPTDEPAAQSIRRMAIHAGEGLFEKSSFQALCRKLARAVDTYVHAAGAISNPCTLPKK